MKILFVWPNKDAHGVKPIGLALLSAVLKREGHEVELFDTSFFDFGVTDYNEELTKHGFFKPVAWGTDVSKKKVDLKEEFFNALWRFQPDIVAISALSDEVELGKEIANFAKEAGLPVIWGNKGAEKLVDADGVVTAGGLVFLGEAIETLPAMLKDFVNMPMKIYPKGYYTDLDGLPFLDWSIFDDRHFLKAYDGEVYRGGDHMIGWGCTNSCSYCINEHWRDLHGGMKGCLRKYSVDRIIYELGALSDLWDLEFFKFHDEDFLLKPIAYFTELSKAYASEIDLPFTCMTNAKNVTPEKVKLLKDMGCVSVSMGIEAGDPVMRQILRRRETPDDIIRAVRLLKGAGIRVSAFNMIGLPFDNCETIERTILLNATAGIEHPNISFFMPLEGTKLYDISVAYGFYDPKNKDTRTDRPTLKLPGISPEKLMYYYENFHSLVTGRKS